MTATINFHNGHNLRALTHCVSGDLTIEIDSADRKCPDGVTIFTDDQVLADRLVEVINSVLEDRKADLAAEAEIARPWDGTHEHARILIAASKGGNVKGITEDHRFEMMDALQSAEVA